MQWTRESATKRIEELKPFLQDLGSRDPFGRVRQLIEKEQRWSSPEAQLLWQHRFHFWDEVLCGSAGQQAGPPAEPALQVTAEQMNTYLRDEPFRRVFFETDAWDLYDENGAFRGDRPEALVNGRIQQLDLDPVQTNPSNDYDWLLAHPRDRLFQHGHQSGHQFMILALAAFHGPDDRWAWKFRNMTCSLIAQCPALPAGYCDTGRGKTAEVPSNVAWSHYGYVANRLHFLLATYALLQDHPCLQGEFHNLVVRLAMVHANHLNALGKDAYRDNYLNATGKALYLASKLLPDSTSTALWQTEMWPHLIEGIDRELLEDGCHIHRSFSYHLTFIQRPLSMLGMATKLDELERLPSGFIDRIRKAMEAFVAVSTPVRSTPGINDDWTSSISYNRLLDLGGRLLDEPGHTYLSTETADGSAPPFLSRLLPSAQLVVMRSDWTRDANYLLFNVSPDGGHHHPCTLSIQVWSGGSPLLIDPGVGHYYTGEREISRRSWWHNCPTLGPVNLPDDLAPRVLHYEASDELVYAVGCIQWNVSDGCPPAEFRRHVLFIEKSCWLIYDEFENLPKGPAIWENLHFAPGEVEASEEGDSYWTVSGENANLSVNTVARGWTNSIEMGARWLSYGGKPETTPLVQAEWESADPLVTACGVMRSNVDYRQSPGLFLFKRLFYGGRSWTPSRGPFCAPPSYIHAKSQNLRFVLPTKAFSR